MHDYFSNFSQINTSKHSTEEQRPAPQQLQQPTMMPVTAESAAIMGVMELTKESIRCFTEYAKCKEHEKTERKRITAQMKVIMHQIDAKKEVYLAALDKHYEERNRLYNIAEKAQEKALELNDKEMLRMCYNLILNVYTQSINMPNLLQNDI